MLKRKAVLFAAVMALAIISAPALEQWRAGAQDEPAVESGIFRSDGLEMEVKAGFGGYGINNYYGNWVPFRITVANHGEPIEGRLVIHTETSANPNVVAHDYVKEINLPTGSRQLHEISAFMSPRYLEPSVKVEVDGRIIAEASVNLDRNSGPRDQLQIAVVDTDSTTLNNITATEIARFGNREPFKIGTLPPESQAQPVSQSGAQPPGASGGQTSTASAQQGRRPRRTLPGSFQQVLSARPIVVSPDDLPRDYFSYDPIEVVAIGDAPLSQLTIEQAHALKMWVASGGLLVVTGAADLAGLRQSKLDDLLPVDARGAGAAASLPELTTIYGNFESDEPLLIMSASLRQGARALIGSDDLPIIAERNYGSGLVRWVALNPKINPYRGWGGAKFLWTDLLLPAGEAPLRHFNWVTVGQRGGNRSNSWGIQNFLYTLAEIEPPSSKYFLLFLLTYILAIGPLNYLVLKRMRKTDLAWLTIPAVVIFFTLVSVTVAQVTRGGSSLAADVTLVELHQEEGILRTLGGLLLMPSYKGTHSISFEGRNTCANELTGGNQPSSASATGTIESEQRPGTYTLRVPLTTWTSSLFQIRSIADQQQPLVTSSAPESAEVEIRNLADAPIMKAVYLSSAGMSDLFEIGPGERQRVALSAPQATTFSSWYATKLDQSSQEGQVFAELASVLDRVIGGERVFEQGFFDKETMENALKKLERPLVVGFIDKSPTAISFRQSLKRRSKSFYVIHL